MKLKQVIIITIVFAVLFAGGLTFYFLQNSAEPLIEKAVDNFPKQRVIGSSVEGRKIEARTYGNGTTHLVFVGGIHGAGRSTICSTCCRCFEHICPYGACR